MYSDIDTVRSYVHSAGHNASTVVGRMLYFALIITVAPLSILACFSPIATAHVLADQS